MHHHFPVELHTYHKCDVTSLLNTIITILNTPSAGDLETPTRSDNKLNETK